jgi:oligosaccharyltransferase complex subunit epsilon
MSKVKAAEDLKKRAKDLEDLSSLSLRNLNVILSAFWAGYTETTPKKVKIIDAYCLVCFLITGIQILYRIIVGDFPMNSFLSGVFASLGSLIITG